MHRGRRDSWRFTAILLLIVAVAAAQGKKRGLTTVGAHSAEASVASLTRWTAGM